MALDINRIVLAAAEPAVGQDNPKQSKGLTTGRALAAGATLVVVGRVAAGPGSRFVRDKIQERFADGSESEDVQDEVVDEESEDELDPEELEAEEDEEPEAELDEDEELEAEVEEDEEPEAEVDEDEELEDEAADVEEDEEPEAEAEGEEPEDAEEEQTEAEEDEQTEAEETGNGARRPRHHPLFEQALAGKGGQRRRIAQPPSGRKPTARPRIAPPRRPSRPSTNGG